LLIVDSFDASLDETFVSILNLCLCLWSVDDMLVSEFCRTVEDFFPCFGGNFSSLFWLVLFRCVEVSVIFLFIEENLLYPNTF